MGKWRVLPSLIRSSTRFACLQRPSIGTWALGQERCFLRQVTVAPRMRPSVQGDMLSVSAWVISIAGEPKYPSELGDSVGTLSRIHTYSRPCALLSKRAASRPLLWHGGDWNPSESPDCIASGRSGARREKRLLCIGQLRRSSAGCRERGPVAPVCHMFPCASLYLYQCASWLVAQHRLPPFGGL